MPYLALLIIHLVSVQFSYPDNNLVVPSRECVAKLEQKLIRQYKKKDCSGEGVEFFHIFSYKLMRHDRSLINDYSLVSNIELVYTRNVKFPRGLSVIYDSNRKILGYADTDIFYCNYNDSDTNGVYRHFDILLDYKFSNPEAIIYRLNYSNANLYFVRKGGRNFVMIIDQGTPAPKVLPLSEFTDFCLDEYFHADIFK